MTGDHLREIAQAAARQAVAQVDPEPARERRRTIVAVAVAVLLVCLLGGGSWVVWRIATLQDQVDAYGDAARVLGDQVRDLGGVPRVDPPPVDNPDPDDPDPDDPDPDDPERQDPEVQDPELQDGELPDSEVQDPEIQESETQDPEIDDPDPNDPAIPGPQGPAGPPPAGWSWVDGDGRTQSCTRDGGPDTAPTYTCTALPPPESVPGGGLDAYATGR
jgi:hypothetical protein